MSTAWYWPDWDASSDPDFGPEAYKQHQEGCQCPDCLADGDDDE